MLTVTEEIPDFDTYEEYLGFQSGTCLFFDIETTGLSASSSIVFLIGAVGRHDGRWLLTQWIAQRPEDEPALLQAFFDAAATCDTLIHFNGTTFDLPFLRERARRTCVAWGPDPDKDRGTLCPFGSSEGLPSVYDPDSRNSLDLYQKFRPLKNLLGLKRMNQTSLEQFLGWPRTDRLTGKHMISLFWKYAGSQEPLLGDLLLLHNHDDLLGMTDLLRLCACSMLFDGQFAQADASILQNQLVLQLKLKAALPKEIALTLPYPFRPAGHRKETAQACTLTASGTQAVLTVPGFRGELRHFFPNYRDYYYLPLEDQAIHKSVASFVDREYRVPAGPENCCIKKSGLFFPQTEEFFSPAFKPSCQSKELFFACPDQEQTPAALSDHQALAAYAASLLRLFPKRAVPSGRTC